jgi:hypothetical protein
MALAVGNDGFATLPAGYQLNVKTWALNVARVSSDTTGFAHSGRTRRLGVLDITGSVGGNPIVSAAGSDVFGLGVGGIGAPAAQSGGTISLHVIGTSTSTTLAAGQAMIQFDAVFASWALSVDKAGESTITMNVEMNDSNGPSIVWSTN